MIFLKFTVFFLIMNGSAHSWELLDENDVKDEKPNSAKFDLTEEEYKNLEGSVTFYLQSEKNIKRLRQIPEGAKSIEELSAGLDWKCLAVTVHGWEQTANSSIHFENELWIKRFGCVAISVDWASSRDVDYIYSVRTMKYVGQKVAEFLDSVIQSTKVPLSQVYMIGHSLGAHVVGFSARSMKVGKPGYIAGLDPAGPLFLLAEPNDRLNDNDADYVECIMTSAGEAGILKPICQANFVVNHGNFQPGCSIDPACSHMFAIAIHYEALEYNDFNSTPCETFGDALFTNCKDTYGKPRMGDLANYKNQVQGIFYTPTGKIKKQNRYLLSLVQ